MFSRNPRPNPPRQPPSQPSPYDRIPPSGAEGYGPPQSYGRPSSNNERPNHDGASQEKRDYPRGLPAGVRMNGGGDARHSSGGQVWQLRPAKSPANQFTFGNLVAVSPFDFPAPRDGGDFYILLNDLYVLTARQFDGFPQGQLSLSDPQRTWASIALTDVVNVKLYDPFQEGGHRYLGSVDAELGFAGRKTTETPFDQDELAQHFTKNFENQVFAPGQRLIMDYKSLPLLIVVKTIQLVDLSMTKAAGTEEPTVSDPRARGILTRQSLMNFFKDARSGINLKASNRRPAANAILQPSFKFEDMGIGGLDKEFSAIFRRAFASRIYPPGIIEKLGIQHVKGILLYGPPGTGKTLIARRIGKMLNAREPKVINGPEVLNKYVGQSEENIRKLFADAEKEYKEKGDESGLHIIIFDELDAVCKQRGSGAAGGTGVGDSVVNQLLSKLDGVDQLNNILLIGMTNRKDMIDEALLRSGRLEVHMEISLPDENGRVQILNIHTAKMRENGNLDPDVNIEELAHLTKNFSGAEIAGLVRSATSFALNRHVKVGTVAGLSDDIENITINRSDFENAFDDVKPAFGVSDEELSRLMPGGIIRFSPFIDNILDEGRLIVQQVQAQDSTPLFSAILHGPPGSGKTALAGKIAIDSEYPLIKLCTPDNMVGFNESMKIEHMRKIFDDAYKSPLSVVVVDNIERIVEWVPVGPRFSNPVLQALMVLLKKQPPTGRRLLVLATTTERSVLQQLDLFTSFDSDIAVPNVGSYEELFHILTQSGAFPDPERAINELRDSIRSDSFGVGIKKILLGIETAKQDRDMAGRFATVIARAVAQMGYS
ncbi:transport between ER and Golgi ATPase protein [Lignoscripta atroalba]|nr:transport between ER and Golgi ATPase protein [Lignoscripta atroalba]